MRLGVCCEASQAGLVFETGFDFVELPLAATLTPDEESFTPSHFRVETFNLFLRNLTLIGEAPTPASSYVFEACRRAKQVGGEVIVFGSSGARRIPDGFPLHEAEIQMEAFLHLCADAAEAAGLMVAIEPLNRQESNFIKSLAEGAAWVRRVNRSGVRLLADTYHMEVEGEPLSEIDKVADILVHVHIADTERKAPGQGAFDYAELGSKLRSVGYEGRVSIECRWDDFGGQLGRAYEAVRVLRR